METLKYTLLRASIDNISGYCPFECERYPEGFTFVMDINVNAYEEEMDDLVVGPKNGKDATVWIFDGDTEDFLTADELHQLVDVSIWKLCDCLMHFSKDKVFQEFNNSILARQYTEEAVEVKIG